MKEHIFLFIYLCIYLFIYFNLFNVDFFSFYNERDVIIIK